MNIYAKNYNSTWPHDRQPQLPGIHGRYSVTPLLAQNTYTYKRNSCKNYKGPESPPEYNTHQRNFHRLPERCLCHTAAECRQAQIIKNHQLPAGHVNVSNVSKGAATPIPWCDLQILHYLQPVLRQFWTQNSRFGLNETVCNSVLSLNTMNILEKELKHNTELHFIAKSMCKMNSGIEKNLLSSREPQLVLQG